MMKDCDFHTYQASAWKTAIYPNIGDNLWYPALGLAGEAGEVAEKIKKVYRDANGVVSADVQTALIEELGDVLWYVAAIASELRVPLEFIAMSNLDKLAKRQREDKLHGSGDER